MPLDSSFKRLCERFSPEDIRTPEDLKNSLEDLTLFWTRYPSHEYARIDLLGVQGTERLSIRIRSLYPAIRDTVGSYLKQSGLNQPWDVCLDEPGEFPVGLPSDGARLGVVASCLSGLQQPDNQSSVSHIWPVGSLLRYWWSEGEFTLCQEETGYLSWVLTSTIRLRPADQPPKHTLVNNACLSDWVQGVLGKPYVWGACGPDCFDCSGLARAFCERFHGLWLARDSHQQMLSGKIVAWHDFLSPLAVGDLLFFTHDDGRVGHVGISLGGLSFLHAEEPVVTVASLDPNSPEFDEYRARHFVFAKRLLVTKP